MSEYFSSSVPGLPPSYHDGTLAAKSGSSALDPPVPLRKLFPSQSERNSSQSSAGNVQDQEPVDVEVSPVDDEDDEFLLKKGPSLVIVILSNVLLQISFFIVVSSSSAYSKHLGGSATFSGLVIGIPTLISGITLVPLLRIDKGQYCIPLHFCCATMVLGFVLYGLAYRAKFLYLILLGRIVQGMGFTFFMYCKRYCSDPRIAGLRRRTELASWLVLGQGVGMSAGPFFGGLLYKVGFENSIFNGYSAPGWLMASVWVLFWIAVTIYYEDVPREESVVTSNVNISWKNLSKRQWGVTATMCWFAMTCFFILGAWESNIPVFASSTSTTEVVSKSLAKTHSVAWLSRIAPRAFPLSPFHWSPFSAGNFIALGGIAIFPFLFLNLLVARRVQDRHVLALGSALGFIGLITTLALLSAQPAHGSLNFAGFFICWFLVALGFNLASTCTLSLLSKQLPPSWNRYTSLAIQYSNFTGRVSGAVWGGSGVKIGMLNYIGLELAIIGIGAVMFMTLWKELKAKTG